MQPRPRGDVPVAVVALGGNAISRFGDDHSEAAQQARIASTVEHLVSVIARGDHRLVLTHGNGPQVGNTLLRSDLAAEAGELPPLGLDVAVAETQGGLGYMIQQALSKALWEAGIDLPVATLVTQVIVDEHDPAFAAPTKPIGRFYPQQRVDELRRRGWVLAPDSSGRGWRRVVPSPEPLEIVEEPVVRTLVDAGVLVIACGGGGIPVIAGESGSLHGVDAVVDKDLASGLLASMLGASTFVILSDVDRVYLAYGAPHQRGLGLVGPGTLQRHAASGHFPAGSMEPKVSAALGFLDRGGGEAIITSPECLADALEGRAGTRVRLFGAGQD